MDTDKTATAQTSRPRGRPRKSPLDQPRRQLKFRATPALAEQLAAGARATGRSVSEEIEYRLEMTFARDLWTRQTLAQLDTEMIGLITKGLMKMAKAGQLRFDNSDPLRGPQYNFIPGTLPDDVDETAAEIAAARHRFVEETAEKIAATGAAWPAATDLPEGESK